MADYWIKFYHEILDDPKMATLPDNIWRRIAELFLLAGRLYKDGYLPETKQIAWALRQNENVLETEMQQIVATEIIEKVKGGWLIVNFKKRQSASTSTERSAAYREKKNREQYYGNATQPQRIVAQITDNRSDTDTDSMRKLVEKMTGYPSTPKDLLALDEMVKIGVIDDDIAGAITFFKDNGKVARGAANLLKSVQFQVGQRTQKNNGYHKKKKIMPFMENGVVVEKEVDE
jgi:hypothetical protein